MLHHFNFLTAASVRPKKAKISLLALTVVPLDHHLVLHARSHCNYRPFVFIVV